jgi:hypothetical protein
MGFGNCLGQLLCGAAARVFILSVLALACVTFPAMSQGKAPTGPIDMTVGAGASGSPDVVMSDDRHRPGEKVEQNLG